MREIITGKKEIILVDDDDYEWLMQWNWWVTNRGYVYTQKTVNHKTSSWLIHRLIMKAEKGQMIDHANRNKLDNRKENLRFASYTQNNANIERPNRNGHRGVQKIYHRYRAMITVSKKDIYLGCFETVEDAARAYNEAAIRYFGEFAILNEVM